jgi:hypothetical protein
LTILFEIVAEPITFLDLPLVDNRSVYSCLNHLPSLKGFIILETCGDIRIRHSFIVCNFVEIGLFGKEASGYSNNESHPGVPERAPFWMIIHGHVSSENAADNTSCARCQVHEGYKVLRSKLFVFSRLAYHDCITHDVNKSL